MERRRRRTVSAKLTGPFSALEEVNVAAAQDRRSQQVPVHETHGGAGDAKNDQGDEQKPELFEQAVGGTARDVDGRRHFPFERVRVCVRT